jgi:hypothetical protein
MTHFLFQENLKMKSILLVLILVTTSVFSACKKTGEYSVKFYDTDIAKLTLFSYSGDYSYGLMNLGHAFLSIDNKSNENITIYNYTLTVGESITLGSWSISQHFGVWFNIESNYIQYNNKYDNRYSISTGLSYDDINTINDFIINNDKWSIVHNCSYFALNLWNSIAENSEKINSRLIYSPQYIQNEISHI